jgi:hypothetical protein
VAGGIIVFGVTIDRIGLVAATLILVVAARFGGPDYYRLKEIAIQYVVVTAAVAFLFITLLALPIRIWPAFLS